MMSQDPHNPLIVAAEVFESGTRRGLLRARSSVVGPWETFSTINPPGSGRQTWIYSVREAADKYVSAQLDYTGADHATLRARLGAVGPWETFSW